MDFRQRLQEESKKGKPDNGEPTIEADDDIVGEYFATDNIKRFPACLELRLVENRRIALPYTHFTQIRYDIETGIEIFTTHEKIKITGRNLLKLWDYLAAYRVRHIQVNVGSDPKDDGLFVGEILVEELNG